MTVDVGERWTGRTAVFLQAALRLSNTAFAERLGISTRTVATWHTFPERVPNSEMQELLGTALQRAPSDAQCRFQSLLHSTTQSQSDRGLDGIGRDSGPDSQRLMVAIAIVIEADKVLVVKRRGISGQPDSWQFPAGMVKPGLDSLTVAARETLAETGVLVEARELIGARVHPDTGVYCEYVRCEYLDGAAENRDEAENVTVAWAPIGRLPSFIAQSRIYPPVLAALREATGDVDGLPSS